MHSRAGRFFIAKVRIHRPRGFQPALPSRTFQNAAFPHEQRCQRTCAARRIRLRRMRPAAIAAGPCQPALAGRAGAPLQGGLARRAGGSSKPQSAQKIRSHIKESGFISYLSALAALCCKLKQLRRAFQTLRVIGKNKSCGVNVNNRKHSSEIFYRSHYAAPFTQSLAYVVEFIVTTQSEIFVKNG